MEIIRRCEAERKGLFYYFTGKPCTEGHISKRRVPNGRCYEYHKADMRTKYKQTGRNEYLLEYQRNMPKEKKNARDAVTRAIRKQATPPWADKKAIKAMYAESRKLTKDTGVYYTIDHIVPLRGKTMSGLHIAHNLRIVLWEENKIKRNAILENIIITMPTIN